MNKYAFVVEGWNPWQNSKFEPLALKVSVYELSEFPKEQVIVPTHNVKGTFKLLDGDFQVDSAYFKAGTEFHYIKVDPIKQFEVNSERWINRVGNGKTIFLTDDLNLQF